ncbi:DUF3391 domain-containing protein [Granulosicoccus sp. 3-233]|uniref:DUF3391 domain-containing protein n=1 Tax=Granulosicoccus sp. 3-233 TaxID=3417969 RepID=UPI003D34FA6E
MRHSNQTSAGRATHRAFTRIVKESRWVHRSQLQIGMYVNELDRPWTDTSFMFQGFEIDSPETLEKVRESCEYAFVQTEKLARVSWVGTRRHVSVVRDH